MTDNRIMIVVDEDTAYAIRNALECYARLGMGQVQLAMEIARPEILVRDPKPKVTVDPHLEQFGISGANEMARRAFDVYQHLRYALHTNHCQDRDPGRKCMSVDHDQPMRVGDPNEKIDVAWLIREGPDAKTRAENHALRNFVLAVDGWAHRPGSERKVMALRDLVDNLARELEGHGGM